MYGAVDVFRSPQAMDLAHATVTGPSKIASPSQTKFITECSMWPDEIHNWMPPPVEMLESFGDMLADEVENRTNSSQDRLYVQTATRDDLMSECLSLQSRQAAEREGLRLHY